MKKQVLIGIIVCVLGGTAMAGDVAIYTYANWWTQAAADREMQEVADNVTGTSVQLFSQEEEAALADWVLARTGDGRVDLLILSGQCPGALYPIGNTQPDGSIMEEFLDDGNCIINTGDWMFYFNTAGNNGDAGMVNIMDLDTMTERWDDGTSVTVTAEGRLYTPSLQNFTTDRCMHLDLLDNGWEPELTLAIAADQARADPAIVRNAETGGRIGIFFEAANDDSLPRGEVLSEMIDNWLLPTLFQMLDPSPANKAVDVSRDSDLSWAVWGDAVAYDVYFGAVLEDVQNATRQDPRGVLLSQGQTGTTCDLPDLLDWATVYYWRVDTVGPAPDSTITQGEALSFTTERPTYPIEGIVATSNMIPADDTQVPENAVDGSGLNDNDEHSTDTTQMWLATAGDAEPMYIQFEFDQVYSLTEMQIWNHNFMFEMALGLGLKDVTVEYSVDGIEWTVFGDIVFAQATGQPTYTANTTVDMQGVPAKFVRFIVLSNYGGGTQYGLSEVRFIHTPKAARNPVPADGAADVAADTELSWHAGREAVTHEVYLGTDPDALSLVATTSDRVYSPALDLDTTYYWQIVEVNEAETPSNWTSEVWSFTTGETLVVDDFESYNDDTDAGRAIWQTWIDGLVEFGGDAENGGGVVGNNTSPFAEQTHVFSGGQAMPLSYDNVSYSHSQTTRTFASAQDWSQHGITTLTVWFKGDLTYPLSDKLYVTVNGTKVTYDGDLTSPIYLPFNVDLTSLGDVSNVTTLSIGVDGSSQGKIYVDRVELYRVAPIDPAAEGDKTLVAHWKFDETSGLTAFDSSGYGNDGTLIGMEGTEWTTGMVGGALQFAGTSSNPQYVDFGDPSSLELYDSATISAWVKMDENNDGVYLGIGGKLSTSYAGFGLVRHTSNVFRLWCDDGAGIIADHDASSDETYTDTEWHHLVGVIDDGTSKLYVDGVKQAKEGSVDLTNSPSYVYLGKQYNDGANHRYWLGLMDDVKIYYRGLSPDEVAGL